MLSIARSNMHHRNARAFLSQCLLACLVALVCNWRQNTSRFDAAFSISPSQSMHTVAALYSSADHVVELTSSNFDQLVIKNTGLTLVEFYANWCGHCKNLAPEWQKAAAALRGLVTLGAVDMDKHQALGQPYDIKGFPTIVLFVGKKAITYSGERTAQAIVEYATKQVARVAAKRLAGPTKKNKGDKSKDGKSSSSEHVPGKVLTITASNFQSQVIDNHDLVLLEFFAPWCGHCKNLAPEWEKAAKHLASLPNVRIAACDATVHTQLAQMHNVKGYPTIRIFKPGKKTQSEDFQAGRTAPEIVSYVRNLAKDMVFDKPAEIVQLTSASVLQDKCNNTADSTKNLCLIASLPHILDSKAKGRNAYIETLKKVSAKNAQQPFNYLWTEGGGVQPKLEEALSVNTAFYPAVTVVNLAKRRYANMLGAFSEDGISSFMAGVMSGREVTRALPDEPAQLTVENVKKWDGKDGRLEPIEQTEEEAAAATPETKASGRPENSKHDDL